MSDTHDRRNPIRGRRSADKAQGAGANLPVVIAEPAPKASAFDAQVLGQDGQKRGLRGGPPVLDHARSAYLEAEYSGPADRRPRRGLFTKTEI